MDQSLQNESEKLARSWMRHDQEMLRDYLVADVEDPRLNLQSILTRHFLVSQCCGDRFRELAAAELTFGAVMNWLLVATKEAGDTEMLGEIVYALGRGADTADGIDLPRFVRTAFRGLPASIGGLTIPNYIADALRETHFCEKQPVLPQGVLSTFQALWFQGLQDQASSELRVLEPACGSANDFRYLDRYGIARLIRYTGVDICEKNISNAKALFPKVTFQVGNVFRIDAPDRAFECVYVHDLLEHLSPQGIEAGVGELARVTANQMCVHFFNMEEIPDDIVNPVDEYHWNLLSVERMRARFSALGFEVQVLNMGAFLRQYIGGERTHNPRAYTFFMTRAGVVCNS